MRTASTRSSIGSAPTTLAGLVQGELGLKLPKADRLTDWLARPLPEGAVTYAVADVLHLHELRERLEAKLEERGRLLWALDECEVHRIRPTSGQVPDRAWWRIKEARSLRGRSAAVAQVLAACIRQIPAPSSTRASGATSTTVGSTTAVPPGHDSCSRARRAW